MVLKCISILCGSVQSEADAHCGFVCLKVPTQAKTINGPLVGSLLPGCINKTTAYQYTAETRELCIPIPGSQNNIHSSFGCAQIYCILPFKTVFIFQLQLKVFGGKAQRNFFLLTSLLGICIFEVLFVDSSSIQPQQQ